MTSAGVALGHVLTGKQLGMPNLDALNSSDLQPAARFWLGTAANKMKFETYKRALAELFRDRSRLGEGVTSLTDKEKTVLRICKGYGGSMSGALMMHELRTRGMIDAEAERNCHNVRLLGKVDPVFSLCSKLLLFCPQGRYDPYANPHHWDSRLHYPDVALLPGSADALEPVKPIPWNPSEAAGHPAACARRFPAEMAFDLGHVAHALAQAQPWQTNRDGSLPKNLAGRLTKLLPGADEQGAAPPGPAVLAYEMLGQLGVITQDHHVARIDRPLLDHHLSSPPAQQSWDWVRAWLVMVRWKDGTGPVGKDGTRNELAEMKAAREFLVWALGRVAHGGHDWLDLETFLADLWSIHRAGSVHWYWSNCSWAPSFTRQPPDDAQGNWLRRMGVWFANALLGTLAHMGLVEHGQTSTQAGVRQCFRLTETGTAVFGAPEAGSLEPSHDTKFLVILPNHELLAYLDVADPRRVGPLARLVRRSGTAAARVHSFVLTRESIYQGLESGMPLDEVQQFLRNHSRTGLPDNLAHAIRDWSGQRDTVIVRTGLALGCAAEGEAKLVFQADQVRAVGDRFCLLPHASAAGQPRGCIVRDHRQPPPPTWRVDEHGQIQTAEVTDTLALAHLSQFTEPIGDGWNITPASIRRARDIGITIDEILGFLQTYAVDDLFPVVELMIRNWAKPPAVSLVPRLVLQVPGADVARTLWDSPRCRPLLLEYIPPMCFLIATDKKREVTALLKKLGFHMDGINLG